MNYDLNAAIPTPVQPTSNNSSQQSRCGNKLPTLTVAWGLAVVSSKIGWTDYEKSCVAFENVQYVAPDLRWIISGVSSGSIWEMGKAANGVADAKRYLQVI